LGKTRQDTTLESAHLLGRIPEKLLRRNDYRLGIVVKVEQDIAWIATSYSGSPVSSKAYYYETLKVGDLVYSLSKRGRAFPLHTTERSLRTGFHTGTIVKAYPKRVIVISDIDGKRYAAKKDGKDYYYKDRVDFFPTLLYDSGNRCNKAFALGQL